MKTFTNEILIPANGYVPQGEKMIPTAQVKRRHFIPDFARFKAGLYWADSGKCSVFPSYECAKNMTEEEALKDLKRRVVEGKNPNVYTTITIYMADGNNLDVHGKNHNYEIGCYIAGKPIRTERKVIFDANGKVNIQATKDANR
jgi:hypothetical protein